MFFLVGMLNNLAYVIMLSATNELVNRGPSYPPVRTGFVLMANIIPSLLIKLTVPMFMGRIPFGVRFFVTTAMSALGLLAVAVSARLPPNATEAQATRLVIMRLMGVVLCGGSSGLGEINFLAYSSYFHASAVSGWSSGSGMAGVLGSATYLVLDAVLNLSLRTSMFICAPLPLGLMWCYVAMRPEKAVPHRRSRLAEAVVAFFQCVWHRLTCCTNRQKVARRYHSLVRDGVIDSGDSGDSSGGGGGGSTAPSPEMEEGYSAAAGVPRKDATDALIDGGPTDAFGRPLKERLSHIRPLVVPYMIPLFVVYFAEYIAQSGISPTIKFRNFQPVRPVHQFVFFQFAYQTGVFLSRSSRSLVAIRRIWVPSVLQVVSTLILLWQALSGDPLPSFPLTFVFIFWIGLLGGCAYVNAFCEVSRVVDKEWREFSMGVVSLADGLGITLASFLALIVQPWIERTRE